MKKVVLITGASSGIGKSIAERLLKDNFILYVAARRTEKMRDLETQGAYVLELDITSENNIVEVVGRIEQEHGGVDILINNAGYAVYGAVEDIPMSEARRQFEVNTIAPLNFTRALLPCLGSGSKVALMTSRMGSIKDNSSGGSYGYRMSKVALSMAGKSLSHDLKPKGIAVAILHPGLVQTRMTNFTPSGITPEESVRGLLARIDALTLDNTGSFWHANGEVLPW